MKIFFKLLLATGAIMVGVGLAYYFSNPDNTIEIGLKPTSAPKPLPYLKYEFSALKEAYVPTASTINLEEVLMESDKYTAYLFAYRTGGKRMTGQFNLPKIASLSSEIPIVLMLRGFVDAESYSTGVGTKNVSAKLAEAGFATIAPDFLGYGGSDNPDSDTMGARLEKPSQILDLIASLPTLNKIDPTRMGLWAHSNGGQIALSLLEITGKEYPTSLWAPVSKGFPYSILYYTDESADGGKALRKALATFEEDYDTDKFSITSYFNWIKAEINLHQGAADDAVPLEWGNDLKNNLEKLGVKVNYYTYPATDHNMRPVWDSVVAHDLAFFTKKLMVKP